MFRLRQKLSLGFGGLLLIIVVIGIQGILRVNELGRSIDVILRENYQSVIACQNMKESLERVDSGVLFVLLGYKGEGGVEIDKYVAEFEKALRVEGNNITLPHEGDTFDTLRKAYTRYKIVLEQVINSSRDIEERRAQYFSELLPLFRNIKQSADTILTMNQDSMTDANMAARQTATHASQLMYVLLLCGTGVATAFVFFTGRWILRPITALIASANEIARGNLDLVVADNTTDEIGQLSHAFNAMASSLRDFRRSNQAKFLRIQHATQQAFDSLPDPIAIVDLDGNGDGRGGRGVQVTAWLMDSRRRLPLDGDFGGRGRANRAPRRAERTWRIHPAVCARGREILPAGGRSNSGFVRASDWGHSCAARCHAIEATG